MTSGNRRGPRSRHRGDGGAAAVEFALLMPLLFLMLFGIISYGFWFNDSLNVSQGVREAARLGVVSNGTCSTGSTPMEKLKCRTKEEIGALTGPTFVKVSAPQGWTRGEPLLVCGMVRADAIPGLVPLPADRMIRSKTQMSIEVAPSASTTPVSAQDTLPSGSDWTWCA